jgi:probable rRNA maturation factor
MTDRAATGSGFDFDFTVRVVSARPHVPRLRLRLRRLAGLIRHCPREVSFALVGDAEMIRVHGQFMGLSTPTDVMTFPLEHDRRGRCTSGEVVVCVAEARRAARVRGSTVPNELLLYCLHGLLHLSGLDDRTPGDYHRMHTTEDRLLTAIGVGPVFAPDDSRKSASSRSRP